jgi:hypothetical protein
MFWVQELWEGPGKGQTRAGAMQVAEGKRTPVGPAVACRVDPVRINILVEVLYPRLVRLGSSLSLFGASGHLTPPSREEGLWQN